MAASSTSAMAHAGFMSSNRTCFLYLSPYNPTYHNLRSKYKEVLGFCVCGFMDWSLLPTNASDRPNDIVFRVHYNGMFFFDPLGYYQVKKHERNMQSLLKKLKGNHMEITDPFAIVEKQNEKFPIYDQQTHWKLKKPKFKECLTYYALANGFSLWIDKSTSKKVIAKCRKRKEVIKDAHIGKQRAFKKIPFNDEKPVCKWRCYGKMMKNEASFQVRSLVDEHTCVRNFQHDAIVELVMKKYKCIVSRTQCRHAKSFALNEGDVALQYHYGYLRFKRGMEIGLWKSYSFRWSFPKKPNSGEILTVVGRDGNNYIFSMAWAIVTVENKDNWSWFLDLLTDDLEVPNGNGLTLISDQHKTLRHGQELTLMKACAVKWLRMGLVNVSTQFWPITKRVVAEQMLEKRSERAAQRQAKQRQPSNFVPPRKKSERQKNLKVAEAVTQGGSTDNVTGK
nr:hypothetical protein [Tanacetum cinerariifolium]